MKQVEFKDVGINGVFFLGGAWCCKIDDSRFIYIGQNGTTCVQYRDLKVFVEPDTIQ